MPGLRRDKFIPKTPYPVVEKNKNRSQIALTGLRSKVGNNNDELPEDEPIKTECSETPRKRKKKSKDSKTPKKKKMKKSSFKTEIND